MRAISKSQLQHTLTKGLSLKAPQFRLRKDDGTLSGSVISDTFRGKSDLERQTMIWDALKRAYGQDAVWLVGMLLAYTPQEWNFDGLELTAPQPPKPKATGSRSGKNGRQEPLRRRAATGRKSKALA